MRMASQSPLTMSIMDFAPRHQAISMLFAVLLNRWESLLLCTKYQSRQVQMLKPVLAKFGMPPCRLG
jgi:hypothetical protein